MKISLTGMLTNARRALPEDQRDVAYMLRQLQKHLLELRERTNRGDLTALDEFFALYVVEDAERYSRPDEGRWKLAARRAWDTAIEGGDVAAAIVLTLTDADVQPWRDAFAKRMDLTDLAELAEIVAGQPER